jgi:hypothetical protein
MSNTRYLEIDSTYRDRNLWPKAGQFEIPISQSGRKTIDTAVDPVSLSVPEIAWTSNNFNKTTNSNTISGTIELTTAPLIASSSTPSTFIISCTSNTLQQLKDYYLGAVIQNTTTTQSRRIVAYEYLGNDGTDLGRISVSPPFTDTIADGNAFSIVDPTQIMTSVSYLFVPAGKVQFNAYPNFILFNETSNTYFTIVDYDFDTHMIQVNSNVGAVGDDYSIRRVNPVFCTTVGAAPTTTQIVITNGSSEDNFYKNMFIRLTPSDYDYINDNLTPPFGEIKRIRSYVGSTKVATLYSGFSSAPTVGDRIEILPFSYDNLNAFNYTGSLVSQQEMVCYEIELLNLVLPNDTLAVGDGGRIAFYPYIYVEISNVSTPGARLKNIIYSNNPNSTNMIFRVPIDDIPTPILSPFIKVDGDGMVQTIKFKPNDNLFFSVRLANGQIYETTLPEPSPPAPPNPRAQISAMFTMRRL